MAGQERATERHCGGDGGEQVLAFIDHHRQDYAEQVPVPHEGEFLIGDYGDGGGVGALGEFKVVLHYLGDKARDEFSRRLLDFGIHDGSHTPLAEVR